MAIYYFIPEWVTGLMTSKVPMVLTRLLSLPVSDTCGIGLEPGNVTLVQATSAPNPQSPSFKSG